MTLYVRIRHARPPVWPSGVDKDAGLTVIVRRDQMEPRQQHLSRLSAGGHGCNRPPLGYVDRTDDPREQRSAPSHHKARRVGPMPYSAEISRTNPSCLLFLIDQSGSMEDPFGGEASRQKAEGVADAINRLIAEPGHQVRQGRGRARLLPCRRHRLRREPGAPRLRRPARRRGARCRSAPSPPPRRASRSGPRRSTTAPAAWSSRRSSSRSGSSRPPRAARRCAAR